MKPERLPSGSYRIRFTDPWGRRTAITAPTSGEAQARYKRALGDMARGDYTDPRHGRITVAEWADDWLASARNLGRGGHDTYRRDLDRYILPAIGKIKLGALTENDVDRYLNGLELAPSSVHRHYRTIRRMLEVARLRHLIPRNVAANVEAPMVPKKERPVLDAGQVESLADTIARRYRAWVYVMCYGGLRWSEAIGLRRHRVDLPRIRVVDQLIHRGVGDWERKEPKAGSSRNVTLPAFAAGELATHLAVYAQQEPDGLVFPTRNGTPVQSPSFTANVFKRALRTAGLPDMRIHDLRHTAVHLAIDAGVHPKQGQARAGHASSSLHLDLYGGLYPSADEAVAAKLEELRAKAMRSRLRAV